MDDPKVPAIKNSHSGIRLILFYFLIALFSFWGCAPEKNSVPAENFEKTYQSFQSWLQSKVRAKVVPSVKAALVNARGNQTTFYIGAKAGRPFSVASITKTLTALAIMMEADKGNLPLDAPVAEYLPGFHGHRKELGSGPIRIRHLLSHSSGLANGLGMRSAGIHGVSLQIPVQIWKTGTHFYYSNINYRLLAMILERLKQKKYSEYMNKVLLPLLNMRDSRMSKYANGASGLITTLEDLSRYARFWLNEATVGGKRLLSAGMLNEMTAPLVEPPPLPTGIYRALAWHVEYSEAEKVYSFSHSGLWYRTACLLKMYPRERVAFIYFADPDYHLSPEVTNFRHQLDARMAELAAHYAGLKKPLRLYFIPKPPDQLLKQYSGEYTNPASGAQILLEYQNGMLKRAGHPLVPASAVIMKDMTLGSLEFHFRQGRVNSLASRLAYWKKANE